jgi:hypothetical protein
MRLFYRVVAETGKDIGKSFFAVCYWENLSFLVYVYGVAGRKAEAQRTLNRLS